MLADLVETNAMFGHPGLHRIAFLELHNAWNERPHDKTDAAV